MKIIIVGSLARERYFPKDLIDCEVWGLNAIYQDWIPRWDRRFNLHTYENLRRYRWPDKFFQREIEWSRDNPDKPFYTLDKWPEPHQLAWPRGIKAPVDLFPYPDVMGSLPRGRYHCDSFDWLVAFAICLNWETEMWGGPGREKPPVDEIALHGVGLTMEAGEPISARACLEYWCGVAEGRGIRVTCAEDCDLFYFYHLVKSNLVYGLNDTPIFEDRTKKSGEAPYTYE